MWTTVVTDQQGGFDCWIREKSDALTRRLLSAISTLVKRNENSGDDRPLQTADDWIKHTKNGLSRYNVLFDLFRRCIKLRYLLPLSEHCYEIKFPTSSESHFLSTDPVNQDRQIKYCFSPAILEYEPELFGMVEYDGSVLFGRKNIVYATVEQRRECRIICPALGMFAK